MLRLRLRLWCFAMCVCSCAVFRWIVERYRGVQPHVWLFVQFICARYMRCVFLGCVRDGGLGDVSACGVAQWCVSVLFVCLYDGSNSSVLS